ncbi:MAG: hypothetical protein LQ349_009475, partial [Xanthoria aureola]
QALIRNASSECQRIQQVDKILAQNPDIQLLTMVEFLRQWCIPYVLQVYSTIPLTENIIAMFHHDFNIGSFAQFGDPSGVARINNRTDFYNMSHLAIRQHLDAENLEDGFVLLDETAASHAVWFVPTTEDSYFYTEQATSYGHLPRGIPRRELHAVADSYPDPGSPSRV